jgi:hypothetical protein
MAVHDVDLEAVDMAFDGPDLLAEPGETAIQDRCYDTARHAPPAVRERPVPPRRSARPLDLLRI